MFWSYADTHGRTRTQNSRVIFTSVWEWKTIGFVRYFGVSGEWGKVLGATNHWFCNVFGAGKGQLEPKTIRFIRFLGMENVLGAKNHWFCRVLCVLKLCGRTRTQTDAGERKTSTLIFTSVWEWTPTGFVRYFIVSGEWRREMR